MRLAHRAFEVFDADHKGFVSEDDLGRRPAINNKCVSVEIKAHLWMSRKILKVYEIFADIR